VAKQHYHRSAFLRAAWRCAVAGLWRCLLKRTVDAWNNGNTAPAVSRANGDGSGRCCCGTYDRCCSFFAQLRTTHFARYITAVTGVSKTISERRKRKRLSVTVILNHRRQQTRYSPYSSARNGTNLLANITMPYKRGLSSYNYLYYETPWISCFGNDEH